MPAAPLPWSCGDAEFFRVLRVDERGLFPDIAHAGEPRAALQSSAKLGKLIGCADGVDFDTGVRQIAHVAAEMQTFRGVLCKVAEAHALHNSRDKESLRLLRVGHKLRNCSRDRLRRTAYLWPVPRWTN